MILGVLSSLALDSVVAVRLSALAAIGEVIGRREREIHWGKVSWGGSAIRRQKPQRLQKNNGSGGSPPGGQPKTTTNVAKTRKGRFLPHRGTR